MPKIGHIPCRNPGLRNQDTALLNQKDTSLIPYFFIKSSKIHLHYKNQTFQA